MDTLKEPCILCGLPMADDSISYCEECYRISKEYPELFKKLREVAQNQYEQGLTDGSKHFSS